ncbi:MAG: hypothetical protein QOE46_1236 [Acidobacteriota bacterium]|jgi:hypothetical protein|nr:hypothetical protein [Acidobacteriota bacterium]
MSSHVTQHLIVSSDPEQVREVIEHIKGAPGTPNELFDLNRIIPMPDVVRRTAELASLDVARQVQTKADYDVLLKNLAAAQYKALCETGFLTWHEWSLEYWGTIHNVFGVRRVEGKPNELRFKSAHAPIVPALLFLSSRFPLVEIELEYLHEDERFIGRSFLRCGEIEYHFYAWDDAEAQELRARLWGESRRQR